MRSISGALEAPFSVVSMKFKNILFAKWGLSTLGKFACSLFPDFAVDLSEMSLHVSDMYM